MRSDPRPTSFTKRRRVLVYSSVSVVVLLIAVGAFARNGWLPRTDAMTGEKFGWFGSKSEPGAIATGPSLGNPPPSSTPQLSKEYIYAGSRMLAVVDANANETPPADLGVWRPGTGVWYVYNLVTTAWTSYTWGASTDKPVPGDYDGDGKTDFAIFRASAGEWWIVLSSTGGNTTLILGTTGDLAAPADYDGDGKTDIAVFRPSNGYWYVYQSSTSSTVSTAWGTSGDVPAAADYDGDGKADRTVWRSSNTKFYSILSTNNSTPEITISGGGTPVSADYDGDGKANYAVRNSASWVIINAALTSTSTTTPSGDAATDEPVQNDYDGDGKIDIAVWRPSNGNWYIRKSGSSNALRQEAWGTNGDIPVPALWRR